MGACGQSWAQAGRSLPATERGAVDGRWSLRATTKRRVISAQGWGGSPHHYPGVWPSGLGLCLTMATHCDHATNMSIRVNIHRLLYATRPGSCVMATERHLRALPKDFWVTLLTYSLNVFSFNGRLERRRLRC
jgi:hypothetical protein